MISDVGKAIRVYRKEGKLTQEELGKLTNISTRAIVNYEGGWRNPSLEMLIRLSNVLNVDLIGDNNDITVNISHKRLSDYSTNELLSEIKRRIESEEDN